MSGIRVVTDSASDLPADIASRYSVVTVPLDVRLGDLGPEETRKLSATEFWQACANTAALPETSAPSPGAFRDAFAQAREDGCDGVVCVTISSELSATYQAACAGAAEVAGDIPVEVIDSRSATMGEGLLVIEAAELATPGSSLEEVAAGVRAAVGAIGVFGTLDTLDNLRRGGRIGSAQAFVGSLLSIKPVIEVRGGVVEGESRQRTRGRSLRYLAEKVAEAEPLRRLAVAHAAASDLGEFLRILAEVHPADDVIVAYIGPVIGAHTGAGTIGVCFLRS
ncbi:MAG TPA: DegV family protein [Acidimicrobiales bacterium]|nr:DegV family protein [Acidimicrobiales bacterium]